MKTIYEPTFNEKMFHDKRKPEGYRSGNHACVWFHPTVDLKSMYCYTGKRKLGYKVFFKSKHVKADEYWNKEFIQRKKDTTAIQNIFWVEGMAPRVLDLIRFKTSKNEYLAQVIELMEEDELGSWTEETMDRMRKITEERHIDWSVIDMGPFHCFKTQFVDFKDFFFLPGYEEGLKQRIVELTSYGWNVPYQSVPELNMKGARDLSKRIEVLDFDNYDFNGKTALVYGCNAGFTCREIAKRGAVKVVGLDYPDVIKGAYELTFYLGYNNIEYYGGDFNHKPNPGDIYEKIKEITGMKEFDVVTHLACMQLNMPDYLDKMCKDVFYFEGHKTETKDKYESEFKSVFPKVEYMGEVNDDLPRPAFKCGY